MERTIPISTADRRVKQVGDLHGKYPRAIKGQGPTFVANQRDPEGKGERRRASYRIAVDMIAQPACTDPNCDLAHPKMDLIQALRREPMPSASGLDAMAEYMVTKYGVGMEMRIAIVKAAPQPEPSDDMAALYAELQAALRKVGVGGLGRIHVTEVVTKIVTAARKP